MKQFLITLLVVVVVFGIYFMLRSKEPHDFATQADNTVVLLDQPNDANDYIVSYAKLSKPGYVFIYATDRSGWRTVVGRSGLLSAGEHFNVSIAKLGGGAGDGDAVTLEAAIIADNGDGVYDEATDTEVLFDSADAEADDTAESPEDTSEEELAGPLEDEESPPDDTEGALESPSASSTDNPDQEQSSQDQNDNNEGTGFVVQEFPRGNMMESLEAPEP